MSDTLFLIDLLYSEKYLFLYLCSYIKDVKSDNYHDFCLGLFDDIDEIIRLLEKSIIDCKDNCDELLNYFTNKVNCLQIS